MMKPRSMAAATQREGWGLVSLDVRAMQQQQQHQQQLVSAKHCDRVRFSKR